MSITSKHLDQIGPVAVSEVTLIDDKDGSEHIVYDALCDACLGHEAAVAQLPKLDEVIEEARKHASERHAL